MKLCSIDACGSRHEARGLCGRHYQRLKKYGDPPFAGSGTTAEACVVEGFRCIAVEREPSYLPLIVARLSKPIQPDLFGGAA